MIEITIFSIWFIVFTFLYLKYEPDDVEDLFLIVVWPVTAYVIFLDWVKDKWRN